MAAVAKNPSFAKKVGVPASVGQEFLTADKGKKFNKGGSMKHEDIAKDKPMMAKVAAKAVKGHEKRMHKRPCHLTNDMVFLISSIIPQNP